MCNLNPILNTPIKKNTVLCTIKIPNKTCFNRKVKNICKHLSSIAVDTFSGYFFKTPLEGKAMFMLQKAFPLEILKVY